MQKLATQILSMQKQRDLVTRSTFGKRTNEKPARTHNDKTKQPKGIINQTEDTINQKLEDRGNQSVHH